MDLRSPGYPALSFIRHLHCLDPPRPCQVLGSIIVPIKIHGDFSTDPSRTKIIIDSESMSAIDGCAEIIVNEVIGLLVDRKPDEYGMLTVLSDIKKDVLASLRGKSPGDVFIERLQCLLRSSISELVDTSDEPGLLLQPDWISQEDFDRICAQTSCFGINVDWERQCPNIRSFLSSMGFPTLTVEESVRNAHNIELSRQSRSRIFAELIKKFRFGLDSGIKKEIAEAKLVDFQSGTKRLVECNPDDKLSDDFRKLVLDHLPDEKDLVWFLRRFGLRVDDQDNHDGFRTPLGRYTTAMMTASTGDKPGGHRLSQHVVNAITDDNTFEAIGDATFTRKAVKKWRSVEENVAACFRQSENAENDH